MITREDGVDQVVYYGAAPVVDPHGYSIEIGDPIIERRFGRRVRDICQVRVATNARGRAAKLRVDLPATGVREVVARLIEWEADHDRDSMRTLTLHIIEWLRRNDPTCFQGLTAYMQSCLNEGTHR
ncbi:hypothetical protein [Nocardia otitidiscaviarum]|uniref:hypothetical protein n=1 Tax=Nocardia otitidiscaviarum TaxID=1823 RepID=UPI0004A75661|nr:hypothetical protein [Nocardia otitidiscaviarum]